MTRLRKLSGLTASVVLMAAAGCASTGQAPEHEVVEDTTVTGSLIKRDVTVKQVNSEGPRPVRTLDKEELKRSSGTTVGDALRSSGVSY